MTRLAAQPKRVFTSLTARRAVLGSRPLEPGTTGWSVVDLDDLRVESKWLSEAFEIIEGVLTTMAPAYFDAGFLLYRLEQQITDHGRLRNVEVGFSHEADIVIDDNRVLRGDAVMVTAEDRIRFSNAASAFGKKVALRQRIYAPPTLIIECVSPGHELHDRQTKAKFYAEFGVPNYWIFEPMKRSLDCFTLKRKKYTLAATGVAPAKVKVPLFEGLKIDLGKIFADMRK